MPEFNALLEHWEPLWLFLILFYEGLVGTATLVILIAEYRYDERKDREKGHKMRRSRKSVKVIVENGQARVLEAPKDIDVTVEQRGQD